MILNQVSLSPFQNLSLQQCLTQMSDDDGLMLFGDGVYALLAGHSGYESLKGVNSLFALEVDVDARNIQPGLPQVKLINYEQWVAHTLTFSHVQTWKG